MAVSTQSVKTVTTSVESRYVFGEECWAEMDGYGMRYLRAGSGPPLVLVHGLLGYSFSWRFNWQALAEKYTVYAVDLLGIGYSERPPLGAVAFDMPRTAERMLRWMEQTGIRDAELVGTSHGGGVALAMAAADKKRKGGRISRLILVAGVNPFTTVGHRRARLFSTRIGGMLLKAVAPWLGLGRSVMLERMYGDHSKITTETLVGYRKPLLLPRSIDYGLAIARSWANDNKYLRVCVEEISGMPVLLIWGDRDRLVPLTSGQELKRHLKDSKFAVMSGCGHLPYEESPEEFNRILLEFLG